MNRGGAASTSSVAADTATDSRVGTAQTAPAHHAKKRAVSSDSGADSDAQSSDDGVANRAKRSSVEAMLALMQSVHASASGHEDSPHIRRRGERATPKKRKPTHTVRKEEISVLTDEVTRLEQRLAFLRGEEIHSTAANAGAEDHSVSPARVEHPLVPNSLLRDAIHEQQLRLASARSLISQYNTNDTTIPIHHYLHLTKSRQERQHTLQQIKSQHLRMSRRYVVERSRHLDLTKPHASSERFVNAIGDTVNLSFSVVQLPGRLTVREVYDTASLFTMNLEISYTDGAGRVTIREQDEESDDPGISQHHYLTTVSEDVMMEGNLVMLHHFDKDQDYGIFTSMFVDRDDLHPYRPAERLRQDITAVLMVARENGVIVLRRMGHVRIHRNDQLSVDQSLLLDVVDGLQHWSNALFAHAKSSFGIK